MQLLNEEKVAQVDATRFPMQPEGIPRDGILSRPLGPTSCDLGPVPPRTETVFELQDEEEGSYFRRNFISILS